MIGGPHFDLNKVVIKSETLTTSIITYNDFVDVDTPHQIIGKYLAEKGLDGHFEAPETKADYQSYNYTNGGALEYSYLDDRLLKIKWYLCSRNAITEDAERRKLQRYINQNLDIFVYESQFTYHYRGRIVKGGFDFERMDNDMCLYTFTIRCDTPFREMWDEAKTYGKEDGFIYNFNSPMPDVNHPGGLYFGRPNTLFSHNEDEADAYSSKKQKPTTLFNGYTKKWTTPDGDYIIPTIGDVIIWPTFYATINHNGIHYIEVNNKQFIRINVIGMVGTAPTECMINTQREKLFYKDGSGKWIQSPWVVDFSIEGFYLDPAIRNIIKLTNWNFDGGPNREILTIEGTYKWL